MPILTISHPLRKTLLLPIIERQFRDSMAVTAEASADDKDLEILPILSGCSCELEKKRTAATAEP